MEWSGAPRFTRSFVLTVYDPAARAVSGWWPWVYHVRAHTDQLPEGAGSVDGKALPGGTMQARTDFGVPGFGGACPPKGDRPHRYVFTLYALKGDRIEVPADATAAMSASTSRTTRSRRPASPQ